MMISTDRLKSPLDCQEVVEILVVGPGRKKWTAAEWNLALVSFCLLFCFLAVMQCA